jgi:hypothetical protein
VRNAIVADSKAHASAMIAWLKLDPKLWEPVVYGQDIKVVYQDAKLIRPLSGVEQQHSDWVFEKLVPSITKHCTVVPPCWRIPQEHVEPFPG